MLLKYTPYHKYPGHETQFALKLSSLGFQNIYVSARKTNNRHEELRDTPSVPAHVSPPNRTSIAHTNVIVNTVLCPDQLWVKINVTMGGVKGFLHKRVTGLHFETQKKHLSWVWWREFFKSCLA